MKNYFKFGLTLKTALPIALLLCITLYAVGVGVFSFQKYQHELSEISDTKLKLLMTATKLAQQSDAIISSSSNLLLASSQFERRKAYFEISDRADWMDKLSREVQKYTNSTSPLSNIEQSKDNLVKNLNDLNKLIEKKLKLEAKLKRSNSDLSAISSEKEAIASQLRTVIKRNKFYSTELSISVGYYVTQVKQEILDKTAELENMMHAKKQNLFASAIISAFAVLFIAIYIHTSIVQRIILLYRNVKKRDVQASDIKIHGDDEIAMLASTIKRYIEKSSEDEQRILSINQELSYLATHDSLTRLYNRRYFEKVASEITSFADNEYCVCLIDIDHFKLVNDKYGHKIGDNALIHTVETIKSGLRDSDIFARYGGEEFIILMLETKLEDGVAAMERTCHQLANSPLIVDGETVKITASFGIVQYELRHEKIDDCLREADIALYEAKNSGRNNVTAFSLNMTFPDEV